MGIFSSKKANKPVIRRMATNRNTYVNFDTTVTTNLDTSAATNNRNTVASVVIEDEYWQTKCPTVLDRTKFIFNKELLSDVKFVVPVSTDKRGRKRVIPAHKFVLAISSPVFFAMFFGQMAETKDSIELSDCGYESVLELFRFLYYEEVNLNGNTVLQVLNLAKQYMVPSLVDKCTEYLRNILEVSNVFHILVPAQTFEEKDLEDQCWKVIEVQTYEVVTSKEFFTVEQSVVESIVKREKLNVKEVDLFIAVDRWATTVIQKQGKTPNGVLKRKILGEKIVKAIRFPLMSQKEFASVVIDSGILTNEENGNMLKYYSNVSTLSLPFIEVGRLKTSFPRCYRFSRFHRPFSDLDRDLDRLFTPAQPRQLQRRPYTGYYDYAESRRSDISDLWRYDGHNPDKLTFTVSKPIKLRGVQHFGSECNVYTVSLKVNDVTLIPAMSLVQQSGEYHSANEDGTFEYYGFDVMFDRPIVLEANKEYELESLINGPLSWYGEQGQTSVESQGVLFTFKNPLESSLRTNAFCGQFPSFLFT